MTEVRLRPLSTRAYLKEVSEALRIYRPALKRYCHYHGPLGAVTGLLGVIWLLFWLPSLAPQFGREIIDSTTHRYTPRTVGQWYDEILPDGERVRARFMGKVPYGGLARVSLGEEWIYRGIHWIWMIPAGKAVPEWVDP